MDQVKNIKPEEGECIILYDVKALFTFVPVNLTINIIKKKLEKFVELPNKTSMSIQNIIALLGLCLKNTYFFFQGNYYEKVWEQPYGHP